MKPKTPTLDQIRSGLDPDAARLLSEVWSIKLASGEWPTARLIHHRFGRTNTERLLGTVGGTAATLSQPGVSLKPTYRLSLLGVLLTNDAERCCTLLVQYLEYLSSRFEADPGFEKVSSAEMADALGHDRTDMRRLANLIDLGSFWGSQGTALGRDEWHAGVPDDIDRFRELDLREYLGDRALRNYDSDIPVDPTQRRAEEVVAYQPYSDSLFPGEPSDTPLASIVSDEGLLSSCLPQFMARNWPEVAKAALGYLERYLRRYRNKKRSGDLNTIAAKLFAPGAEYQFPFCTNAGQQQGMMLLYQGAASSLRNLTHHEGMQLDRVAAMNIVGFVNFLLSSGRQATRQKLAAPSELKHDRNSRNDVGITVLNDEPTYGHYHDGDCINFHLMWRLTNNGTTTVEAKRCTITDDSGNKLRILHGPSHYEKNSRITDYVLRPTDHMRMALIGEAFALAEDQCLVVKLKVLDPEGRLLAERDIRIPPRGCNDQRT